MKVIQKWNRRRNTYKIYHENENKICYENKRYANVIEIKSTRIIYFLESVNISVLDVFLIHSVE